MIKWMSFPKYKKIEPHMMDIVDVFEKEYARFTSEQYTKESNKVLEDVTEGLEGIGYLVEKGKRKDQKIHIPVLYGENGKQVLAFDADAYNFSQKTVIEVEAGRAVVNYQFLKDFYQACMMQDVEHLCIAVRNDYKGKDDFKKVCDFFDTLFMSNKMEIPLKSILIIGY